MTSISIDVENNIAQSFIQASIDEKQKFQLLLGLRLQELISKPEASLTELMDDMGNYAQSQGMTEQVLDRLLDEE
jgi:hypothetical protein